MDFEKRDVLVGGLLLGALALAALTLFAVNRERQTARTYHLTIRLPNISGMDKGTDVIYRGYKAGSVDQVAIAYEPDFCFNLRLDIRREIRLRRGTQVVARSKGFGVGNYLELIPPPEGGAPADYVREGERLEAASEMDLMTRANDVMTEVKKFITDLDRGGARQDMQDVLKRTKSSLNSLDAALRALTTVIDENRVTLKQSLEEFHGVSAETNRILKSEGRSIQQTLANVNQASAHLPSIAKNTEEFILLLKRQPWRLVWKGKLEAVQVDHDHAKENAAVKAP
jgi:ABC-type transporter Mla subunit MlaD